MGKKRWHHYQTAKSVPYQEEFTEPYVENVMQPFTEYDTAYRLKVSTQEIEAKAKAVIAQ